MRDFLDSDRQWKSEITDYIRKVDDKASNAGRADLATLATWAGVIIAIIVAIGGAIGFLEDRNQTQNQQWIVRELDHHWDAIGKLDGRREDPLSVPARNTRQRQQTAQEFLSQ